MLTIFKLAAPLIIGTALYLWQAGIFLYTDNKPMAIVFLGYSVANIGLIIAAIR